MQFMNWTPQDWWPYPFPPIAGGQEPPTPVFNPDFGSTAGTDRFSFYVDKATGVEYARDLRTGKSTKTGNVFPVVTPQDELLASTRARQFATGENLSEALIGTARSMGLIQAPAQGRAPNVSAVIDKTTGDLFAVNLDTNTQTRLGRFDFAGIDPEAQFGRELAAEQRQRFFALQQQASNQGFQSQQQQLEYAYLGQQEAGRQQFTAAEAARQRGFTTAERLGSEQFAAGQAGLEQAFRTGERLGGQQFEAGESALQRAARLGETQAGFQEAATGRQFQGQENALDRALRAGEFAATHGLNAARFGLETDQERVQRTRQAQQDALNAATQLSNVISQTDPAAFQAFVQGGGGVIANAIAGGGNALSENALLPAARVLRSIANPVSLTMPQFTIPQYAAPSPAPNPYAAMVTQVPQPAPVYAAPPAFSPSSAPNPGPIAIGSPTFNALFNPVPFDVAAEQAKAKASMGIGPIGTLTARAHGGPVNGMAIVGERGQEAVVDPTGDAYVISNPMARRLGLLDGGLRGLAGGGLVSPADQPYLAQALSLRTGVDAEPTVPGGPFNVLWRYVLPTIQDRFYKARQAKFGVPVADQIAEAARFALPGIGRGDLTFAR